MGVFVCVITQCVHGLIGLPSLVHGIPLTYSMNEIIPFIERLALESGALIKRYVESGDLGVEYKEDGSHVTRADKDAEVAADDLEDSSY